MAGAIYVPLIFSLSYPIFPLSVLSWIELLDRIEFLVAMFSLPQITFLAVAAFFRRLASYTHRFLVDQTKEK